ncbi:MAG: dual specificity protein phosphatase family protein [Alphaproteobacteria bacterium]|nr:dual specificity protein phosphatase family protein [Alphaproteobacteria bacterium]
MSWNYFSFSPRVRRWLLGFGVVACCVAFYAGYLYLTNNFHAVETGAFYRSAQPKGDELAGYVRGYGIKTVINLRGSNEGKAWYDDEIAESKRLGLTHINFRMSARRKLVKDEALRLMEVFKTAEKPILVHCHSGADRTGLASALYVAGVQKGGEEEAESQLSIRYGHIIFPFFYEYKMDATFESLETMFGYENS